MTLEDVSINWPAALTAVKSKQSVLNTLVSALEAALASGALGLPIASDSGPANGGESTPPLTGELPSGAFMGKSLRASILLFLSVNKRQVSTAEITQALKDGGAESAATDFDSVVAATLNQLRKKGDVMRYKDGWVFAEHLSESFRKRLLDGPKPKPTSRTKKKKAAAKKAAKPNAASEPRPVAVEGQDARVQQMPKAV